MRSLAARTTCTHCSSICLRSGLNVEMSLFSSLLFAFNGLSSNSSSSNSCVASKLAFLFCEEEEVSSHLAMHQEKYDNRLTSGSNGGMAVFDSIACQSIPENQGCFLKSSIPCESTSGSTWFAAYYSQAFPFSIAQLFYVLYLGGSSAPIAFCLPQ